MCRRASGAVLTAIRFELGDALPVPPLIADEGLVGLAYPVVACRDEVSYAWRISGVRTGLGEVRVVRRCEILWTGIGKGGKKDERSSKFVFRSSRHASGAGKEAARAGACYPWYPPLVTNRLVRVVERWPGAQLSARRTNDQRDRACESVRGERSSRGCQTREEHLEVFPRRGGAFGLSLCDCCLVRATGRAVLLYDPVSACSSGSIGPLYRSCGEKSGTT